MRSVKIRKNRKLSDIIADALRIAKKYGISETRFMYWILLENLANEMLLILYQDYGENLRLAFREYAKLTGVPLTDEQSKAYMQRLDAYLKQIQVTNKEN